MDWNGLINWSSKYHDPTAKPSDFKPMNVDDQKWLTEALMEYSFNEIDVMQDLMSKIKNRKNYSD
jgi:hypothetical protein